MCFCLSGNFSNCKTFPGKCGYLVVVILRLFWIPLKCGLCVSARLDVQHVPIAMTTKFCNQKQSCSKVTYCPLVPAWATTIHKFQGFEAGFDKNDQFKQLIVDPRDLTTKLLNRGTQYVTLSRAKTIGTVTPNELHPKDSAIFWTGSGICFNRVLNITQKKGHDGNMTNCLRVEKRQKWVNLLFKQNRITTSKQYKAKWMREIEGKLLKNIERMKRVELQPAIATIITNPNEKWNKLKREKYMVPKSYFQN
jgi:hypothetical protein